MFEYNLYPIYILLLLTNFIYIKSFFITIIIKSCFCWYFCWRRFFGFSRKIHSFKQNIHLVNPTIVWSFQRYPINFIVSLLVFFKQESWKFWNNMMNYLPLVSDRLLKTKIKTHKSKYKYQNYSSLQCY